MMRTPTNYGEQCQEAARLRDTHPEKKQKAELGGYRHTERRSYEMISLKTDTQIKITRNETSILGRRKLRRNGPGREPHAKSGSQNPMSHHSDLHWKV